MQTLSGWRIKHDPGTSGTSVGAMTMVSDPSLSGQAQQVHTSFTDWGGELVFPHVWKRFRPPRTLFMTRRSGSKKGSQLGNLEMDNNQVMANGDTVIYAFQCAGDSNTWDYTENAGTPAAADRKMGSIERTLQSRQLDAECVASRADQLLSRRFRERNVPLSMARRA